MKYRTLGKTGLRVSVIGVGTWQLGGEWDKVFTQSEVTAMFAKARDLGVNLIDTAECYGDHTSEFLIGNALAELGARNQFIIATKFGHKFHEPFKRSEPRSGPDIQKQLDDSLRELKTDYIDLYQYHSWADAQYESDEVRGVLEKALAGGKVRHVGTSTSKNDNAFQVERADKYHVEAVQLIYNRLSRAPETAVLPLCQKLNLGVLARVPLASGYLSGKYKPGDKFPATDVREKWYTKDRDEQLAEVQRIAREEVPAGVPMARWALAWCLQHPAITCVIPGAKSVQQVEDNALAADLDIVRLDHPQVA